MQDVTPPYYEMTVLSPSVFGDEILVHGMPVGNIFQFMWNAAGKDKKERNARKKKGDAYASCFRVVLLTLMFLSLSCRMDKHLVAVSFQFIGVLLTYLLHNSHASKVNDFAPVNYFFCMNYGKHQSDSNFFC